MFVVLNGAGDPSDPVVFGPFMYQERALSFQLWLVGLNLKAEEAGARMIDPEWVHVREVIEPTGLLMEEMESGSTASSQDNG